MAGCVTAFFTTVYLIDFFPTILFISRYIKNDREVEGIRDKEGNSHLKRGYYVPGKDCAGHLYMCYNNSESSPKPAHKQKGPVLLDIYHPPLPGPQKVLSGHTVDKQRYHGLNAISTKPMLLTLHKVFLLWSSCYMARNFANDFP